MYIDWNPSPQLQKKAKKVASMRAKGFTWEVIRKEFGNDRAYLVALFNWWKKNREGNHSVAK